MAQGQIGGVGGVNGAGGVQNTLKVMMDVMQLMMDVAQQGNGNNNGGGQSQDPMQALQDLLQGHKQSAANQVQPPDDAASADGAGGVDGPSGSGQKDPMKGLMQIVMELLQMLMKMMEQGNDDDAGDGGGGASPSSTPAANNVANQLPSGGGSPLGLGGGDGGGGGGGNGGGSGGGVGGVGGPSGASAGGGAPSFGGGGGAPSAGGSPSGSGTPGAGGSSSQPTAGSGATKVDSDGSFSKDAVNGPLSEADSKTMATHTAKRLEKDFGFTQDQAAGIVGNLYHESAGMNSNVNEFGSDPNSPTYGKPNDTQFGYGWAQWTGSRKTDFENFAKANGMDPSSPEANYQFLKSELNGSESATVGAVKGTGSAEDAATAFRKVYERATNPVDQSRIADANSVDQWLN